MKATETKTRNQRILSLENGKVITCNELHDMLKALNIYVAFFIDTETKDEFIDLTGFSFHHNYDDCKTYTLIQV